MYNHKSLGEEGWNGWGDMVNEKYLCAYKSDQQTSSLDV